MPEIVPEVVPDPPLHRAQIVLAFRKKDFYVFYWNVFGHYEGVDRALVRALFRALFGLYQGSTRPTKVSASPVPS